MKLELSSKINQSQNPATYLWDKAYRENYDLYQQEIDALTYGLQRSQRGVCIFGHSAYPNFHQKNILKLNIYKKKQLLGEIFQNEVDQYKKINEHIVQDLNNTFRSSFRFPTQGLVLGALTFPLAHYMNLQYSFRAGLFVVPVVANILKNSLNVESYFNTLEFMDYVLAQRKGLASLEMDKENFKNEATQKYKELYNDNKSVQQRFQQLVDLVKTEQ